MSGRRSVSDLLREAAARLDEMDQTNATSTSGRAPGTTGTVVDTEPCTSATTSSTASLRGSVGLHPVDAEVSRLFAPYNNQVRSRRQFRRAHNSQHNTYTHTYTHTFCCLGRKDTHVVPNRVTKEHLQRCGLGERRLIFRGNQENSQEFVESLFTSFPKLRDAGGFELMRISGTTRSRQLAVVPCPNDGYTVSYLKDPRTMINHATLFVRPMQRNLSMEHESNEGPREDNTGPLIACLRCGGEFPFSQIRQHSETCSSKLIWHFQLAQPAGTTSRRY